MSFYNRSAYRFNGVAIPQCFLELDKHLTHMSIEEGLAENICRRMADVDLYATLIAKALQDIDRFQGGIKVGSFLVGYFSASKSLLDAGSTSLCNIQITSSQ